MNRLTRIITPLVIIFSASQNTSGQNPGFSAGMDVAYNLSQYKSHEASYSSWYAKGWTGNFSPALTLKYGDKLSGVFRGIYIFNRFEKEHYGSSGGPGYKEYNDLHQIYLDLLLEIAIKAKADIFFHVGYGAGIPVRNKYESKYESEFINPDYFLNLEAIIGMGLFVPLGQKNGLRIESNIRLGIYKIPVHGEYGNDNEDTRTFELQFIMGYLRHFKKST